MSSVIWFIVGAVVGGIAGVFVMSMCAVAGDSDRKMEETKND